MKINHKYKTSHVDIIEYCLVILLILNCRSMYITVPDYGTLLSYGISGLICLCCLLSVILKGVFKRNIIYVALLSAVAVFAYGCIYIIFSRYNIFAFLVLLITVACLTFYYISIIGESIYPTLFRKYTNVVTIISVISLLIWLFGPILHILQPTGTIYTTWTPTENPLIVKSYFGIFFERQTLRFLGIFDETVRNTAFFAEAPMASFIFSTATLIEALLNKKPRVYILFILFLANASTLATTGILVDIAIMAAMYLMYKPKHIFFKLVKYIIFPLIILISLYSMRFLFFEKISSSSGTVRLDDIITGYRAWRSSPIFGHGYENGDALKRFMSQWRLFNTGFSNSLMQILAQGGVVLFLPYAICLVYGIIKAIKQRNFSLFVFCSGFLIIFSITLVSYVYIVYVILLYLLMRGTGQEYEKKL